MSQSSISRSPCRSHVIYFRKISMSFSFSSNCLKKHSCIMFGDCASSGPFWWEPNWSNCTLVPHENCNGDCKIRFFHLSSQNQVYVQEPVLVQGRLKFVWVRKRLGEPWEQRQEDQLLAFLFGFHLILSWKKWGFLESVHTTTTRNYGVPGN